MTLWLVARVQAQYITPLSIAAPAFSGEMSFKRRSWRWCHTANTPVMLREMLRASIFLGLRIYTPSLVDMTRNLTVPGDTLVEPIIRGHELMKFPTMAFLIVNQVSGKEILFDWDARKAFGTFPLQLRKSLMRKCRGSKSTKILSRSWSRRRLMSQRWTHPS